MNHFTLLGLAPQFNLDLSALEQRYFQLQRQFHPDRIRTLSTLERTAALRMSMAANEAYNTLKHPLTRARHLLALEGIHVGGENDTIRPNMTMLEESLEQRELLMEADSSQALELLLQEAQKIQENTIESLAGAFSSRNTALAAELTLSLGYVEKWKAAIAQKLQAAKTE